MPWNAPCFSEKQRFRQWWLWLLVLISPVFLIWAIFQQVVMDVPFGNNPTSDLVPVSYTHLTLPTILLV